MNPEKEKTGKRKGNFEGRKEDEGKAKKKKANAEENEDSEKEESDEEREEGGTVIAGVYVPPAPPAVCSLETTGPRLIITHITIENFKSYQGRQVLGPFHKSFTSIIGPNGSGKSNVIDSMLFVFGYRATKIRSKKLSVLIHKSEKYQNLRCCTVAVHFAQINDMVGDEFEIIKGTEIVVARTAFSDNSSKYSVNGKTKTFKEVMSLLLSHGIDLKHNRFLILQGEVEQIAMMKPKAATEHETGMLEYLEDIIGTVRYKKPIAKLGVKLEAVDEERHEKLNRLKMVEKEKDALKLPLREAIEYLQKDNARIVNYNKMYHVLLYECKKSIQSKEEEKKDIDDKVAAIDKKIKEINLSSSTQEKELNGHIKALETMKNQYAKLKENFNKLENRHTELKEEISLHNKRKKKDNESKRQDENKLAELLKVPEKNNKDIIELEAKKIKLAEDEEKEKENVKAIMAEVSEQIKPLNEQLDKLRNELIGLKKINDSNKEAFNLATTKLDLYVNNEKKENEKLKQLKALIESSAEKLQTRAKEVADLEKKIPPCEREITALQVELQTVRVGESQAAKEHNVALSELDDKRNSAQSTRSRNQVLEFIMKQKHSGAIPGVFGRLGDLGGIDAKYDVAISTACGPLDHIVVDTVRTGKDCVDALKKNDIGRANFIALEKVAWLINQYSKPITTPENVPRLFDLIKPSDEKYKPAFYFSLRDTLVAKDLEQAKRVAYGYKRFRVVTLDGEIIEIAGTMSGGGNQKLRGRMGRNPAVIEIDPDQMAALASKVKELQGALTGYREQRIRLEDTLASRHRQLEGWKDQYQTYSHELKELRKGEGQMKQQLNAQEKRTAETVADPNKVRELQDTVNITKEALEKSTKDTDSVESELKSVNDQIAILSGERVKTAQKKLSNITKHIDKITKEISKLSVAIKTSRRETTKAEDRIQGYVAELKQTEEFLLKCKAEIEKLTEDSAKINEEAEKLADKINESEAIIANLRKGVTCFVKQESKLKAEKINVEQNLDGYIKDIQHLTGKVAGLEAKIKDLVLHVIPTEEEEERVSNDDDDDEEEEVEEEQEAEDQLVLKRYTDDELIALVSIDNIYNTLKYEGTYLDTQLSKMKYNPQVIVDYQNNVALYKKRFAELNEVTERRNEIRKGHDELRKARFSEFMAGFMIISNKLKEMYQMITFGGDAEFELADNLDPFSEGVIFSVRPPRKSWKIISNLSGGEKTLSSLALVFALHYYKPSPLYFMDEIDAALDFKNVSIVGHYIKERTKNAQFIIISLRSNMFELADVLVGIYKTHNCTKSVTVTPRLYAKQEETCESTNN